MSRLAVLSFTLLLASAPLSAAPLADLAEIDRAVAAFTGAPIGQPGGAAVPADRRLRLAPCAVPVALSWYGTGQRSVLVQCPLPGGWRLYVPVMGAPQAAAAAPVVVRGEAVTITVRSEGFAVSRAGEALDPGPQGGWIRVRPADAPAGQVLRAQVLRPGLVGIDLP